VEDKQEKIYTVGLSYKIRVEAMSDVDAVVSATYHIPSARTTHVEVRVLGARPVDPVPPESAPEAAAPEPTPAPEEQKL
jgi:hypothetical protein